eukprot:6207387-Pleurochrysis_carterae.AAC.3
MASRDDGSRKVLTKRCSWGDCCGGINVHSCQIGQFHNHMYVSLQSSILNKLLYPAPALTSSRNSLAVPDLVHSSPYLAAIILVPAYCCCTCTLRDTSALAPVAPARPRIPVFLLHLRRGPTIPYAPYHAHTRYPGTARPSRAAIISAALLGSGELS